MSGGEVLIRFQPSGKEVCVRPGVSLCDAVEAAGLRFELPCGGEGLCGRCRLRVRAGAGASNDVERQWLSDDELGAGWRLACQSVVVGPAEIEVPADALTDAEHRILASSAQTMPGKEPGKMVSDSPVQKRYVELPPPARGDDLPDMLRLERALDMGPLQADLPLLRQLPGLLRRLDFRGTAITACGRLLDFEQGNTEAECFAVAVDVGTTTLAAALLDLASGKELAVEARLNPQTRFGDDVLSRILHVRRNPDGLRALHETILAAVNEMIERLCLQAGVSSERVYAATFAGNTAMQHLFCGVDPGPLGESPFAPAAARGATFSAAELGLALHPRGIAYVLPTIGGFVGGDTVAGILAADFTADDGPALFIDIGTNGEIVLWAGGKLSAASTAAGPAFEGARITRGMRGCTGAIEKVCVEKGQLKIGVIGHARPAGLCGSALIDAAAELLRHGLLSPQGRLTAPDRMPPDTAPDLARRVALAEGQPAFPLAFGSESADGDALLLPQRALRELQLASGAIRAGIAVLLARNGLKPNDLKRVRIGGGFGNFIRRSNARRIGLLPGEIERELIRVLGNTSLAGARLAAFSLCARQKAEELARRAEHVDLSTDPGFQRAFAEAMHFPESEASEALSPGTHRMS